MRNWLRSLNGWQWAFLIACGLAALSTALQAPGTVVLVLIGVAVFLAVASAKGDR